MTADQEPNPFRPPAENGPPPASPWQAPGGYGMPPRPQAWPTAAAPPAPGHAATPAGPPPGYGWPAVPVYTGPRNGLGTAGFVLGVIALSLVWTFVLSPLALVLAVLGVIFAAVGVRRARAGTATNRVIALGGLWTGVAGCALAVTLTAVLAVYGAAEEYEVEFGPGKDRLAGAHDTVDYESGLLVTIGEPEWMGRGTVALTVELVNEHDERNAELRDADVVAYADGDRLPAADVRLSGAEPGVIGPEDAATVGYAVAVPPGTETLTLDYAPGPDFAVGYWEFPLPPPPAGGGGGAGGMDV